MGEDLALDHEGGPDSYTVVVVADPRRGSTARVTVTINVIDAPESASVALSPEGMPAVGRQLTASVGHPDGPDGEATVVSWQWQRSAGGTSWQTIAGADTGSYTPTEADAGHRLRVIVLYRPPGGRGIAGAVGYRHRTAVRHGGVPCGVSRFPGHGARAGRY